MIAILKYNAGNATSVENAVHSLGFEVIATDDAEILKKADKVIFPGVGQAGTAMQYLRDKGLDVLISNLKQPFFGICLGMQLLCKSSEEGNTKGLGIFNTEVKKFPAKDIVPHMGWDNFNWVRGSLFKKVDPESDCYFIHSYYAETCEQTIAMTNYILPFSSALQKDNFYGVQFHPEKSAETGLQILKNFLEL